jgi:hypothetical protein
MKFAGTRRRARLLALGLAAGASLTGATAARADADPQTGTRPDQQPFFGPAEFLEKSYVFYSLPSPSPNPTSFGPEGARAPSSLWLILEGQPALHFYFWNRLQQFIREKDPIHHWAFAPSFTLQMQIRFLRTTSSPVRTPSFMPRLNFQVFRLDFNTGHAKYREIEMVFHLGHHSNGQENCSFTANRLDDQNCPPFDTNNPDYSRTNLINGGFGTNYLALGGHGKWVTDVDGNNYARTSWSGGVVGEYHPTNFGPGGLDDVHSRLYGQTRVRFEGEFQRMTDLMVSGRLPHAVGHARVAAAVEAIFGTGPGIAPYVAWVEASRTFLELGGAGLFARVYSGQDYYNINYVNRIDIQVHAGVIIDFSTPLQFGSGHPEWHKDNSF